MRYFTIFVLVLFLSALLVGGCGKKEEPVTEEQPATTTEVEKPAEELVDTVIKEVEAAPIEDSTVKEVIEEEVGEH